MRGIMRCSFFSATVTQGAKAVLSGSENRTEEGVPLTCRSHIDSSGSFSRPKGR